MTRPSIPNRRMPKLCRQSTMTRMCTKLFTGDRDFTMNIVDSLKRSSGTTRDNINYEHVICRTRYCRTRRANIRALRVNGFV